MLTDSVKSDSHLRCEQPACPRPHVFVMTYGAPDLTPIRYSRHLTAQELQRRNELNLKEREYRDAYDTLTEAQQDAHAVLVGLMEDLDDGRDERMALIQYAKRLA